MFILILYVPSSYVIIAQKKIFIIFKFCYIYRLLLYHFLPLKELQFFFFAKCFFSYDKSIRDRSLSKWNICICMYNVYGSRFMSINIKLTCNKVLLALCQQMWTLVKKNTHIHTHEWKEEENWRKIIQDGNKLPILWRVVVGYILYGWGKNIHRTQCQRIFFLNNFFCVQCEVYTYFRQFLTIPLTKLLVIVIGG